jgi:hypothetical protein
MARKFLYLVAALIVLTLAAAFAYRLWSDQLMIAAFVPDSAFVAPTPRSPADYGDGRLWYAYGARRNLPQPAGAAPTPERPAKRQAAVFFVHPTSFIDRSAWNSPENDAKAATDARTYIAGEANVFAGLGPLWAPRYRQATFGAFLTDKPEAEQAFDAAYRDVAAAFEAFLVAYPEGPIILAGHSQGSRHLMRLLAERIAGRPVARRIVAAYLAGWPISVTADLPVLGLPACTAPAQARCVLSWQSFAQPADTGAVRRSYDAGKGVTGRPKRATAMLCVNPLTGTTGNIAATGNIGMARRDPAGRQTFMQPGVGARCDRQGFLILDAAPALGPFVLPGNNYHIYDYALFWGNIRADATRRLDTFLTR